MSQRTVLLVDDEPGIRECLCRLLQRAGWRVTTAPGPAEALELLGTWRPDALILDVRMPDPSGRLYSGLDLLHFLRSRPDYVALPVILLTGYFLTADEDLAVRQNGATVLYKPADLPSLAGALGQLVDGSPPLAPGVP
jgi:CheY-like chemotaxis protein